MTTAPATLTALGSYWTGPGGVNLGIVGDTAHADRGVSYHLGKSQLTATAYSRQTARDKAGLTEAASAIDLGRMDGTLPKLRDFSRWLVVQAQADQPGTSDMREIIYSPDGTKVLRWDRERGATSDPQTGEADASHLTHTHISWYRDAQTRDHTTAFRPYFEGASMGTSFTPGPAIGVFTFSAAANLIDSSTNEYYAAPNGYIRNVSGAVTVKDGKYAGQPAYLVSRDGRSCLALAAHGTYAPAPAPDCTAAVALVQKQLDIANGRIKTGVTALGGTI